MISSLKKNLSSQKKINSKKHNENFSNYFDNIIDIFKNSLSSDQMQKSESLVNINNKNTINIMAESLIKINKNITKNNNNNNHHYRCNSLFDEDSFSKYKEIFNSLCDEEEKKKCKTVRQYNKIYDKMKLDKNVSSSKRERNNNNNSNINVKNNTSRISQNKTKSKLYNHKNYINNNKSDFVGLFKNNIYDCSNCNKEKNKKKKSNSQNKKKYNYKNKMIYPYFKSKNYNYNENISKADLLINNYLFLIKSK